MCGRDDVLVAGREAVKLPVKEFLEALEGSPQDQSAKRPETRVREKGNQESTPKVRNPA
jgi:hypothetical protein